jgi:hypothetical protein
VVDARGADTLRHIFADFGLEVHVKKAGDTVASKSVVLFYPKPARCYTDTAAFDGVDLSDSDIGNGEPTVPALPISAPGGGGGGGPPLFGRRPGDLVGFFGVLWGPFGVFEMKKTAGGHASYACSRSFGANINNK